MRVTSGYQDENPRFDMYGIDPSPNYKSFYIWWFQICVYGLLTFWLGYMGIFNIIWEADITHLTQLVAVIAIIASARIGYLSWLVADKSRYILAKVKKHVDEWWFVSEQFMALGILGTVAGFIYFFYTSFGSIKGMATVTPDIVQQAIPKIINPMGTIFFTTAVGLAASVIIKTQLLLFTSWSGIEDESYEKD